MESRSSEIRDSNLLVSHLFNRELKSLPFQVRNALLRTRKLICASTASVVRHPSDNLDVSLHLLLIHLLTKDYVFTEFRLKNSQLKPFYGMSITCCQLRLTWEFSCLLRAGCTNAS